MILLLIFLPLNFKEYFFNYFNLREKVADFSERSSRRFSSAVGAYWKHCEPQMISNRKWSRRKTRNGMEFVPLVEILIIFILNKN